MKLNDHDLIGLRRLADDAQRDGHFDDAETLRELCDAWETIPKLSDQIEALEARIEEFEDERSTRV